MTDMSKLFSQIKGSMKQDKPSGFGNFLKTPPGYTYIVKLLPYVKDPSKTFFHHYIHNLTSCSTRQWMSVLSPQTFGDRDPISEIYWPAIKGDDEELKAKFKNVSRSEKWLVNVLVLEDPNEPDNKGKVKILNYGKQLGIIIENAISGDDSDEFGSRVFDVDGDGVVLKIKVEKQGDFPNYTQSRFAASKLKLDDEKYKKFLDSCHELDTIHIRKTPEEVEEIIKEHILCSGAGLIGGGVAKQDVSSSDASNTDSVVENVDDLVSGLDLGLGENPKPKKSTPVSNVEDDIDDILDGIDIPF